MSNFLKEDAGGMACMFAEDTGYSHDEVEGWCRERLSFCIVYALWRVNACKFTGTVKAEAGAGTMRSQVLTAELCTKPTDWLPVGDCRLSLFPVLRDSYFMPIK